MFDEIKNSNARLPKHLDDELKCGLILATATGETLLKPVSLYSVDSHVLCR